MVSDNFIKCHFQTGAPNKAYSMVFSLSSQILSLSIRFPSGLNAYILLPSKIMELAHSEDIYLCFFFSSKLTNNK